jgi:hypothetical protein
LLPVELTVTGIMTCILLVRTQISELKTYFADEYLKISNAIKEEIINFFHGDFSIYFVDQDLSTVIGVCSACKENIKEAVTENTNDEEKLAFCVPLKNLKVVYFPFSDFPEDINIQLISQNETISAVVENFYFLVNESGVIYLQSLVKSGKEVSSQN